MEIKLNILRSVVLSFGLVMALTLSMKLYDYKMIFLFIFHFISFLFQLTIFDIAKDKITSIMNKTSKTQDLITKGDLKGDEKIGG
jgi:hypothetical protein